MCDRFVVTERCPKVLIVLQNKREFFVSHLWTLNALENGERCWRATSLSRESCALTLASGGLRLGAPARGPALATSVVSILAAALPGARPVWTLLAGPQCMVRINAQPLGLGIRVLRDRDEISFAGQRCFFSTEEFARIVPFSGLAQPAAHCPRCKQRMEPGEPAVACPHCRAWHHQSEKYPCWTYATTCALCQIQSTALDAGYSWTPEML